MPSKISRSPEEWQAIINQQQAGGLSGPQFCKEHSISYPSFNTWKRRLHTEKQLNSDSKNSISSDFIDLSQLSTIHNGLRITLKLGNGVEIELSQL